MRGAAFALALLALTETTARAESEYRYTALTLGYEGRALGYSLANDDTGLSSVQHLVPRLSLTNYGIDWYMKLELGWPLAALLEKASLGATRPSAPSRTLGTELYLHDAPMYGRVEVGTHWPKGPGVLAVGVAAGGHALGIGTKDRGHFVAGGTGGTVGLFTHYAFPLFDRVRVDPSAGVWASLLDGKERGTSTAIGARFELELMFALTSVLSIELLAGLDLLRVAARDLAPGATPTDFSGHGLRFGAGIALHDLWILGANRFDVPERRGATTEVEVDLDALDAGPPPPFGLARPLDLPYLDREGRFDLTEHVGTSTPGTTRLVVVDFGASYCEPCMAELPDYAALAERFADRGVSFTFVTVDDTDAGREKVKRRTRGVSLHVLSDGDQQVANVWEVRILPTLFVIDRQARVRFFRVGLGPDTLSELERTLEALLLE